MNDSRPNFPRQASDVILVDADAESGPVAHELRTALVLLGSDRDCEINLASPAESDGHAPKLDRVHAAIVKLGGAAYVCDLGAAGGTILNGRRIKWARIANGDDIFVGPRGFEVRLSSPTAPSAAEHPVFKLRSEGTIGVITSIEPILIVGSAPNCDVVIEDRSVAARHCVVVWTDEGPIVRRIQTELPTLLNGRSIRSALIAEGDLIGVGSHTLAFESESAATPRESPASDGSRPRSVSASVRKLLSGRLAGDWTRNPSGLWVGKNQTVAPRGGRRNAPAEALAAAAAASETIDPTTAPPEGAAAAGKLDIQADETFFDVRNQGQLSERIAELRHRVAAAQSALDARARKHWDGLERERENLRIREAELSRQAEALQAAAAETIGSSPGPEDPADAVTPADPHLSEQRASNNPPIFSDTDATPAVEHSSTILDRDLEGRMAELVAMARAVGEELRRSEGAIETLRLENERLRSSIARQRERLESQRTTLAERFRSLEQSRESIRNEREPLVTRIRRLDAEEAAVASSLEAAAQVRSELDREVEALAQAQGRFKAQQQMLFDRLELERKRIHGRQTEIQLKTAEMERVLRGRLSDIEVELSARKSELQQVPGDIASAIAAIRIAAASGADESLDRLAGDTAEQLAALRRIEEASMSDTARLDALKQRVEALNQAKSLFEQRKGWQGKRSSGGIRGLKKAGTPAVATAKTIETDENDAPSDLSE